MQGFLLALPRASKRLLVMTLDVLMSLCATWVALSLRLDTPNWPVDDQWRVYALSAVLFIPVFVRLGLYRAIFRYTGQVALVSSAKAVAIYALLLTPILLWHKWQGVPRTLGVLQPLIFFLLIGASRAFARFWLADMDRRLAVRRKLLIYGAGAAGVQTAGALAFNGHFDVLGFVDDDADKIGRSINGVSVYARAEVAELVAVLGVSDILLALPSASRERRNAIIQSLQALPVHIRTLPGVADLASGRVTVQDIKELDIEDLLGRDPVPPRADLLARKLGGKVVLVSGAGGSIGSELCRQILAQRPRQLLLLDHAEFNLYSIHQELAALARLQGQAVDLQPLLASVIDVARLQAIFRRYRPQAVYHAAAYKHVPLVESNPVVGVLNNVVGTLCLARAALDAGVAHFVLISTDKAVRPTNAMGASKRMAELVLQALAAQGGSTCFSMVRFGNVLGSSGSVVPLFRRQLLSGGPLTVTHAEVTRYFMTIPEAAQLVLQAGATAQGGEVFVLDMGEPVRILDLARRMIELSGMSLRDAAHPQGDIAIEIIGLRPGEKLYEELLIGDNPQATAHPRIMQAREAFLAWEALEPLLQTLQQAGQSDAWEPMQAVLRRCVQGYAQTADAPASAAALAQVAGVAE